jgi:hypothetical protein
VVAIDPSNGDVLAMVSQPSFNPNLFVTGIGFKAYAELRDSIDRPLFNRVLRGLYPPGSTIKPAVAVAGLDSGVVTGATRVFDPGFYQLPNYEHKYRNWNRTGDGWVNMEMAIMRSNDTYFYDLAHKLGVDRLGKYLGQFGIGQKVSLDMFEESAGLMPSREWKRARYRQAWYPGETLILGIGQGYMQTTPLQLAQVTALLANQGRVVVRNGRSRARVGWDIAVGAVPDCRQERHGPGGGDQAGREVRPLQGAGAPSRPCPVYRLCPGRQAADRGGGDGRERRVRLRRRRTGGQAGTGCLVVGPRWAAQTGVSCARE